MNGEKLPSDLIDKLNKLPGGSEAVEIMKEFQATSERSELIKIAEVNFDKEKKLVPKLNPVHNTDVLIITVGMREAPIILSILILGAREVHLLHTYGSKRIAEKVMNDPDIKRRNIEFHLKEIDEVDATKIYSSVKEILDGISSIDKNVVIDPTSGRKAMSAGIASLAFYYDIPMKYLLGVEKMGIIMPFSEIMKDIPNPYTYFGNTEISLITSAMRNYDFAGAINLHSTLKSKIRNSEVYKYMARLKELSEIYLRWDEFEHSNPNKKVSLSDDLREIMTHYSSEVSMLPEDSKAQIMKNICFLKNIENLWEEDNFIMHDKFRIIDLYQNAERLSERGFYTDALARLYRLLELIVFHIVAHIFSDSGIKLTRSDEVTISDLENLMEKDSTVSKIKVNDFRSNKFGVVDLIQVIKVKGEYQPLAKRYLDSSQSDIRESRNKSLAGHGTSPVRKEHYEAYRRYIIEWISKIMKNKEREELEDISKFPSFVEP